MNSLTPENLRSKRIFGPWLPLCISLHPKEITLTISKTSIKSLLICWSKNYKFLQSQAIHLTGRLPIWFAQWLDCENGSHVLPCKNAQQRQPPERDVPRQIETKTKKMVCHHPEREGSSSGYPYTKSYGVYLP